MCMCVYVGMLCVVLTNHRMHKFEVRCLLPCRSSFQNALNVVYSVFVFLIVGSACGVWLLVYRIIADVRLCVFSMLCMFPKCHGSSTCSVGICRFLFRAYRDTLCFYYWHCMRHQNVFSVLFLNMFAGVKKTPSRGLRSVPCEVHTRQGSRPNARKTG